MKVIYSDKKQDFLICRASSLIRDTRSLVYKYWEYSHSCPSSVKHILIQAPHKERKMYPVENDFRKRNYFSIPENQSITRSSSSRYKSSERHFRLILSFFVLCSVASDITNSSEDNDVESFLITLYTQQIKEKNISIG